MVADPSTTPTNQNPNGWGMKVADYFIPYNVAALDAADQDFGSAGPLLLPDSAGIPGHPHLMIASGKQGKIYLIDRDDMGKFDPTNDDVLNSVPDGSGHNTPAVLLSGGLSTAAYFNGTIYMVSGYSGDAIAFTIQTNGLLSTTSQTAVSTFGYLPGSPSISSSGTSNGIVWLMDRNTNEIHAYSAATLSTELWNSGQKAGGADSVGAVVKFAVPTVANGEVFVGTTSGLVVYGLTPPASVAPLQPTNVTAAALSGTSVQLGWQDPTTLPNTATGYDIFESLDGTNYNLVTTAPSGATGISLGGLQPSTTYDFEVEGYNSVGASPPSTPVSVTTTVASAINFGGGFAGAVGTLTLNGTTAIKGTKLELVSGVANQAGSAFSTSEVTVTGFTSQFTFQVGAGAGTADGLTFTIQGKAATALGPNGGGLGYGPANVGGTGGIAESVAVKFDLYSNHGEGVDSTGLYTDGASPTNVGSIDLTATGVNLHSGDVMQASLSYDGTTLTVTIADAQTGKTATESYAINIPATVGGGTAYVGFTGGDRRPGVDPGHPHLDLLAQCDAGAGGAVVALGAAPASAHVGEPELDQQRHQPGRVLPRPGHRRRLHRRTWSPQTLAASATSFTDAAAGLAPGGTFYYRIRAFNSAGASANSNTAQVTIPLAPPKPSDAAVVQVTTHRDRPELDRQRRRGGAGLHHPPAGRRRRRLRAGRHPAGAEPRRRPPLTRPGRTPTSRRGRTTSTTSRRSTCRATTTSPGPTRRRSPRRRRA